jgi:hypothetical protein
LDGRAAGVKVTYFKLFSRHSAASFHHIAEIQL